MKALPGFLALQLVFVGVILLRPDLTIRVFGEWLSTLPVAHAFAKNAVWMWSAVLFRQRFGLGALGWGLVGVVLPGLAGRLRRVTTLAWFAAPLALAFLDRAPPAGWIWGVCCALWLWSNTRALPGSLRWAAWIPGVAILLPAPVATAAGLPPIVQRGMRLVAALLVSVVWLVGDAVLNVDAYGPTVIDWPADHVDPRVIEVASAPPGVRCEFHDVDVVGTRVIVVGEGTHQLYSFPTTPPYVAAVAPLRPSWPPLSGLTLDSETSGESTWFLEGPATIGVRHWTDGAWGALRTVPIQARLDHMYTRWLPDLGRLALVNVNGQQMPMPSMLVTLRAPELTDVRVLTLRLPDGSLAPTFRDIEWLPRLGRFVLEPNFSDRLYLMDPQTGRTEPWVQVPAMNGKLSYSVALDRLFVALPSRPAVWVIDPNLGAVERTIPTQPGVRPVAVDAERGLLVTASIATGSIWVQRIDDGTLVDSFRTVMPLVRSIALDPATGTAWLATWTKLYAFPYTGGAG